MWIFYPSFFIVAITVIDIDTSQNTVAMSTIGINKTCFVIYICVRKLYTVLFTY